jgi:hypothetical protein
MNRCPENREWVLYAAAELPAARRLALQSHLACCEGCRGELAAVARGLAALDAMDSAPPLRTEAAQLLRRSLAEAAARRAARPWVLSFIHRHRWGAAAAAVFWIALAASLIAPVPRGSHNWITDTQVVEEIAEITAGVEMLEVGDYAKAYENGVIHKAPASDVFEDEVDRFLLELSAELGVEG